MFARWIANIWHGNAKKPPVNHSNQDFLRAVNDFCRKAEDRAEYVVFGVAKELHERLVDITPYRTGRARASWTISADVEDSEPAPDIGIGTNPFATDEEIRMANVFYDSLINNRSRFQQVNGAPVYYITNTVHYIEKLNGGSSRQAPPGFFQTTVVSAGIIVQRVVNGIRI